MSTRKLTVENLSWPVRGAFTISRSSLTQIPVVTITLESALGRGHAECRPYARYDETQDSVTSEIEKVRSALEAGATRDDIQAIMPAGAARNAVDNALWDLEAKETGIPVWERLNLRKPKRRLTAFTLSIDKPEKMAAAALDASDYPLLKIKTGSQNALESIYAILEARPDAKLIVDANEAVDISDINAFRQKLNDPRIALIEQPLASKLDQEDIFPTMTGPPICADESLHTSADLPKMKAAGYGAVNVKLDKCGGLTEGYKMMKSAKEMGFTIMAGCMVGSSLAMAPMMMLESFADFIDLDGPLLLSDDTRPSLTYKGPYIYPPRRALWG